MVKLIRVLQDGEFIPHNPDSQHQLQGLGVGLFGSDFATNRILAEYQFPDFFWQIRHGAANLRVVDQLYMGSAHARGWTSGGLRLLLDAEFSAPIAKEPLRTNRR